jgi:hypothetical protein
MNELSKIIVLVSLLYLLPLAVRLPQTALKNDSSKHQILGTVVVLGLTAVSLLALGVYLKLILS